MEKLTISKISLADLKRVTNFQYQGIADYEWTQGDSVPLSDREWQQLEYIQSHFLTYDTQLMNDSTIWARAIYPLLMLAEQGDIQAWGQVPLQAHYSNFEIEGIADGVLARYEAGSLTRPYLVVVETKKGVEGQHPVPQLYGQLLAAAHLNWEDNRQPSQEIFGCYTIADTWKLVRAEIDGIDADKPLLRIEDSREYTEKIEAEIILKILKNIVAKYAKLAVG